MEEPRPKVDMSMARPVPLVTNPLGAKPPGYPAPPIKKKGYKGSFTKELKWMLYGFGDVTSPLPESVDLMEDIVIEYISEMTSKAMQVSTKRNKLLLEDLVFLVRKDKKKFARVKELLHMYDELKKARKSMDVPTEKNNNLNLLLIHFTLSLSTFE